MARPSFKSVEHYIAAQPESARPVLERVRDLIKKAVPGLDEAISYGIVGYKLQGRVVIYFAGFKQHYSLYPASDRMIAAIPELANRRASKGTIRFSFEEPVPAKLIREMVKFRAQEVSQLPAKRPARKKRSA